MPTAIPAQTGQAGWNNQGTGVNDFIVQAMLDKRSFLEMREKRTFSNLSAYAGDSQRPDLPNGGMVPGAVVQTVPLGEGENEARFTLERRLTGKPTYGDEPVRPGDYQAYQHQSVFANEIDSLAYPIPGRMSQLKAKKVITDPKSAVRREIANWHGEQDEYDHVDALLFGASGNLIENTAGSERLNLGAGAGVPVLPEIFYVQHPTNPAWATIAGTPRTAAYNDNVAAAIAAANGGTRRFADRKVARAIYEIGIAQKTKKAGGADWDFVCVCDPAILSSIVKVDGTTNNTLYSAWLQSLAGDKNQRVFDYRGAIAIDGVLYLPSEYLAQYRTNGGASLAATAFGTAGAGNYFADRRGTVATGGMGFAFLLGEQAMLRAEREILHIEERDGKEVFGKSWDAMGWTIRGIQRSYWTPKDGNTTGLQQSSIGFAFPVDPTINPFV